MNRGLIIALLLIAVLGSSLLLGVGYQPAGSQAPQQVSIQATIKNVIDGDTIEVHFDDFNDDPQSTDHIILLAGINAPEISKSDDHPKPCQSVGESARDTVKDWVPRGTKVSIKLGSTGDKYIPYYTGDYDRLLGFVQTSPGSASIQTELTKLGLARLDIRTSALRDVKRPNSGKFAFAELFSSQIKSLLKAQTEAAKQKRGWWSACDPFRKANLVITAIDFWDYPQVVYIVNRGTLPIDWTKFSLSDETKSHHLDFNTITPTLAARCSTLASGQALEVRTYNEQGKDSVNCNTDPIVISWYPNNIGSGDHVWNEGHEGDTACLFLTAVPGAGCKKDATQPAENNGLCYVYRYPPQDGTQTPSATIDRHCLQPAKA